VALRNTRPKWSGDSGRLASERDAKATAEYLQRLRELKPLWNRNLLWIFLPGFLLFGIGGPLGLLLPGGKANHNVWLLIAGLALCVIGAVRGARLMWQYRRCPVCDRFQEPDMRPYRVCPRCGTRLAGNWNETA
jgi:hypothetical protein